MNTFLDWFGPKESQSKPDSGPSKSSNEQHTNNNTNIAWTATPNPPKRTGCLLPNLQACERAKWGSKQ